MLTTDLVNSAANFVVLGYLIPLGLFVYLYATRSPWRSTELGKALMLQKAALAAIILILCASYFFGADYAGREWVRLIGFSLVGVTFIIDVVNLVRYQRGRRPKD